LIAEKEREKKRSKAMTLKIVGTQIDGNDDV
jgi:hypothetical protein